MGALVGPDAARRSQRASDTADADTADAIDKVTAKVTAKVSAKITVRDLLVVRNGQAVLEIPALDIPAGRVTAIIGPNGAGKSTLLAVLQLLLRPRRGDLRLDDAPVWNDALATRRRLASVFQEALLLNTSVRKNVETALGLRGVARRERRPRAERWLARFGVAHLARRHAHDLSGGEAQRVSLARAFALEPEVLLLDEPFGGLDAPTRVALIDDFADVVHDAGVTTVLVTHDRDEALRLADGLAVLVDGRLRQFGPPRTVFAAPADEEVAALVGVENVWPAQLCDVTDGVATYAVGSHRLQVAPAGQASPPPPRALFCLRPEEVTIQAPSTVLPGKHSARNRLPATVVAVEPVGPVVRLRLTIASEHRAGTAAEKLIATVTRPSLETLELEPGSRVIATFKATAAHVIPRTAGDTG